MVDAEKFKQGPFAYIEREYPLVAGKLIDLEILDVRVFGLSSVGGDLKYDADYRKAFLQAGPDGHGWVAVDEPDEWKKDPDITLPIAWAVGL